MPSARPSSARRTVIVTVLAAALLALAPTPVSAGTPRYFKQERYALSLLNCLRTGGSVTKHGRCHGRGSGSRAPLARHVGIANEVARPYARLLARHDATGHTYRSSIDQRFRQAGYRSSTNGESLYWSSGYTVRQMVIRSARFFQAEKSYDGPHWKNLRDRDFRHVGIGIASIDGEKRIVYDFYR